MFTVIHTDDGIIRRVLRGNNDAFRVLLDRYGNVVYGVAYARTGNAADAEDVTQETFVRLYQWLDRIAGRATVGPWLVEVARNAANDVLRRRQREASIPAPEQAVPARDFARDELRRMVWEQLAGLDDTHREVLILHYFQNVKLREIARLLNISREAAKKRLLRSRDELGKRLLSEVGEETAAKPASARKKKVMAAIAAAPPAWQPSPALSLAGAAIVGASAIKTISAIAAAAILIAIGIYAGWRHVNRPYDTQNITAQSTFEQKATEVRAKPATTSQLDTAPEGETPPPPDDAQEAPAAPKAAVYGFVLDTSFNAIAGATVRLTNTEAMSYVAGMKTAGYCPFSIEPLELTTVSGDDGSFYFEQVPLAEDALLSTVLVTGEKGGLFGETAFRCPAASREQYVELIVEPAATLTVRVVDETGAPVPEAKVSVSPANAPMRYQPARTAGPDGTLEIPSLMPGLYAIGAGQYGYADVSERQVLAAGKHTIVLTLGKGNTLSGRLTFAEDGSPIPDVIIRTYCPGRPQPSAKTDASGNFLMKGLDADFYEFNLGSDAAPYVIVDSPRIRVTQGVPVTGVKVQAAAGAFVSGTVRDEQTNAPVPLAQIIFAAPGNNYSNGTWPRTYSDRDGRYSTGPFIPNRYEVLLWGSAGLTKRAFTLPSLQDMQNVDFKIAHELRFGGAVIDADGKPAPGANVVATGRRGHLAFDIADDAGRFSLSLGASEHPIYVQASYFGLVSPLTGPAREAKDIVLRLQSAARINGYVVDTAGRPQPEMTVVAVPAQIEMNTILSPTGPAWSSGGESGGTSAETSRSGFFQIAPILPGAYELDVYAKSSPVGYPAATAKASVTAGQTLQTKLVINTGAFGHAEGRVIINGAPMPGAFVGAGADGEEWIGSAMAYTDANGFYRIQNLRPGNMNIRMRAWNDQRRWDRNEDVVVVAGETIRVDFEVGETGCGFEGYVSFANAPALASILLVPAGATDQDKLRYETDMRGYYRAADLEEGVYDVEVQDLFYPEKVYATAAAVEARANEVIRLDFAVGAGNIEGIVERIREGEIAHVAVFPETADFSIISAALGGEIIASTTVSTGEAFHFEQLPPATYYVGAVAIPADKVNDEAALLAQISRGRYTISPVEVIPGETAAIDLALP